MSREQLLKILEKFKNLDGGLFENDIGWPNEHGCDTIAIKHAEKPYEGFSILVSDGKRLYEYTLDRSDYGFCRSLHCTNLGASGDTIKRDNEAAKDLFCIVMFQLVIEDITKLLFLSTRSLAEVPS